MTITIISKPTKSFRPQVICYFHDPENAFHADSPASGRSFAATKPLTINADGSTLVFDFQLDKYRDFEGGELLRVVAGTSIRQIRQAGQQHLAWFLDGTVSPAQCRDFLSGALLAAYRFNAYKSNGNDTEVDVKLTIVAGPNLKLFKKELQRLEIIFEGVNTARDLANTPGSDLVPQDLADYAKTMAKAQGLEYKALSAQQLERAGYVGLVNVGRGSANPPVLFTLTHTPKKTAPGAQPLCLVGKGLTFDAGGINLKGFQGMWDMKADMGGAATVVGAMRAIARLGLPVPVVGVVAAAQNMPDGNSYLPGDILRFRNGRTVEIQNTDAEGRLVLADALLYAQDKLKQARIVDFATLTGACFRALGHQYIGLMSRSAGLKQQVAAAAETSGEAVWELPLNLEYRQMLKSSIADVRNIGGPLAGAQTAGWFLHEFIKDGTEYVHLDIAGSFIAEKAEKYWSQPGMTGSGTRLAIALAEMLCG